MSAQVNSVRQAALAAVVLSATVVTSVGLLASPASAGLQHPAVVLDNPVNYTPNVIDGGGVETTDVYAFEQVGDTMYAGGTFAQVADAGSIVPTYPRSNLMAFGADDGVMTDFAPSIGGPVWAIEHDPTTDSLYVAGQFTQVNGLTRRGVVKLDPQTGAVDTAFNARLGTGKVNDMHLVGGQLYLGGTFPGIMRTVSPATGADTGKFALPITGTTAANAGPTDVYRFSISPDGTRLVAIGNFTTVAGQARSRAFMANLGDAGATLASWYYAPLVNKCKATRLPAYLRGVDFSPDGSYFVLVSTGSVPLTGGEGRDICDAAARFETAVANPTRPTWINYTKGDTLHSVVATGAAVYVQGHMRFLDNGTAPREGIGAINPVTGLALPWNPGKTRAVGGRVLEATSTGVWVGSDGARFRNERRDNIAFVPLP